MNNRFFTFIMITAISGWITVSAQRPNNAGRFIQTLPAEIQTAVAELAGTFQAERTALTVQLRNGSISRQDFQAKQAELATKHRADVMALLTPEQRAEWEANQARRTQQQSIRRQAFMSTYFERMTTDMKLNPAKKASLKRLMDDHMATMAPRNMSVKDEERASLNEQVKALLTAEEYQIFRTYIDAHQAQSGQRMQHQQPQRRPRRQN